jgi:hypothetical protein
MWPKRASSPTFYGDPSSEGGPWGPLAAEDSPMKGFLLGLTISLAFIGGCVAGATKFLLPEADASYVVEQRWSYFCFQEGNVDSVNFKANAAGSRGWELVSSAGDAKGGDPIWCFRQPKP